MVMHSKYLTLALAAVVLVIVGCDTVEPEDPVVGQFQASVEGDMVGTIAGPASAAVDTDQTTGEEFFFVLMTQVETGSQVALFRMGAAPEVGAYEITAWDEEGNLPEGEFGAEARLITGALTSLVVSESGSLEITAVNGEEIAGAFAFTAAGQAADQTGQVHPIAVSISGEFEAVRN
jgi:hypothetical protein